MILDWLARKPAEPPSNAWVASRVQTRRIEALLGWFERHVPLVWGFDAEPYGLRCGRLRHVNPYHLGATHSSKPIASRWRRSSGSSSRTR